MQVQRSCFAYRSFSHDVTAAIFVYKTMNLNSAVTSLLLDDFNFKFSAPLLDLYEGYRHCLILIYSNHTKKHFINI